MSIPGQHRALQKAAEQTVDLTQPTGNASTAVQTVEVVPTQVRRPWRSSLRTAFQAGVALAVLWPIVVDALGLPDWAWVGMATAVAAGITRVMAVPQVEVWLRTFLPFLAAAPKVVDQ